MPLKACPFKEGDQVYDPFAKKLATFIRIKHFCGGTDVVVRYRGQRHNTNIAWMPNRPLSSCVVAAPERRK